MTSNLARPGPDCARCREPLDADGYCSAQDCPRTETYGHFMARYLQIVCERTPAARQALADLAAIQDGRQ